MGVRFHSTWNLDPRSSEKRQSASAYRCRVEFVVVGRPTRTNKRHNDGCGLSSGQKSTFMCIQVYIYIFCAPKRCTVLALVVILVESNYAWCFPSTGTCVSYDVLVLRTRYCSTWQYVGMIMVLEKYYWRTIV
jgi:hypothetical protein